MKNKILFLLIFLSSLFQNITAQSIQWQNTIGGNNYDELSTAVLTSSGGYILGGSSNSNISGDKSEAAVGAQDYWVVKTDLQGVIQWEKTIGGNNQEILQEVQQTADGGYILAGTSSSGISGDKTEAAQGNFDYWIVKLDNTGAILWQNTIGGSNADRLASIKQTSGGGFIVAGHSLSPISGDKTENNNGLYDYWVVKLNNTGVVMWDKTIGGNNIELLEEVSQTSNGGYLLGGTSNSDMSGDKTENSQGSNDYWIVKLDAMGNFVWDNTIGGALDDDFKDIIQTSDNGYFVGGTSISGVSGDKTEASNGAEDMWVLKLDNAGSISWQNTLGGSSSDENTTVLELANNDYVVAGHSSSGIGGDKSENSYGGKDFWSVTLSSSGSIIQDKTYGGMGSDKLFAMDTSATGGLMYAGFSNSDSNGDKSENAIGSSDYWIFGVDCLTPDLPTLAATTNVICPAGSSTKIYVQSGNLNDAEDWQWYSGTCGGTSLGSGDTLTANPTSTTSYYVRGEGGCVNAGDCDSITIDVGVGINTSSDVTSVSCYSDTTGSIDMTTTGGTPPFSYDWDNDGLGDNDDSEDLNNLGKGIYSVIITDDLGCKDTVQDTVDQPNPFFITVNPIDEVTGNDGAIGLTVSGENPPYSYNWIGPNNYTSTLQDNSALEGGTYIITVEDSLGCDTTFSVSIDAHVGLKEQQQEVNLSLYPNPNNGSFTLESQSSFKQGNIEVVDMTGRTILSRSVTQQKEQINLSNIANGVYTLNFISDSESKSISFIVK